MNSPSEHYRQIAQRMENAVTNFRENVQNTIHCSEQDAATVLQVYIKLKVVKLDAVHGVYRVKHGAFWDAETLTAALSFRS